MTKHILEAYKEDIAIRRKDKLVLGVPEQADGFKVNTREITPGTVYRDDNVTVKAFAVNHGDVTQAFGYRIELFPIVTALFMASLMLLFGQRRWLGLVLYPIAVTVFIYVLFGMLLRVPL